MAYPMKQKMMVMNGNKANNLAAAKLLVTAKGYVAKYKELGQERIMGITRGQSPGKIVVAQAQVLRNKSHVPMEEAGIGERFKVSASFEGEVDSVGLGSAYYALKHLGVRKVDIWGDSPKGVTKTNLSMSAMVNEFGVTPEAKIPSGIKSYLPEVVLLSCSDSRVVEGDLFAGHDIEVVNNAGNVLSPTALEAIGSLVYMGVPVVSILGHSQCGAVGAALAGNKEEPLAPIMKLVGANLGGEKSGGEIRQRDAEIKNVLASCKVLLGMEYVREQFASHDFAKLSVIRSNIKEKGTVVLPLYLDLASGEVTDLRPMLSE